MKEEIRKERIQALISTITIKCINTTYKLQKNNITNSNHRQFFPDVFIYIFRPTQFPKSNSWNAYPGSSDEGDDEEESINNNNRVLPELRGYSEDEDEEEEEAKTQQKEKEKLVDSSTKSSVPTPRGGGGCLAPVL